MGNRLDLSKILHSFGNNHIYYQPPENLKMEYPAIRYSLKNIKSRYGDNIKYSNMNCYEIIVVDRKPDNEAIQKILSLPHSSFDRRYVSDGLYHDSITLYY